MPDAEPVGDGGRDLTAPEVVDGEPAPDSRRLIATTEFSGPLPLPSVLRDYEQVKPGLSDIIVEQWQAETRHRHKTIDAITETDREAVRSYYKGEQRGQRFALVFLLGVLVVALVAIVLDRTAIGIASLVVGGGAAAGALLRRPPPGGHEAPPKDVGEGEQLEQPAERD